MRSLPRISALSAAAFAALVGLYVLTHQSVPQAQASVGFSPTALTVGDKLTNEAWDAF